MKMTLVSVNVSQPKTVSHRGRSVTTGIFKTPVSGRVMVRRTNLDGDRQADLSVHGGVDKAVYVYPSEHYTAWAQELGRDDFPSVSLEKISRSKACWKRRFTSAIRFASAACS